MIAHRTTPIDGHYQFLFFLFWKKKESKHKRKKKPSFFISVSKKQVNFSFRYAHKRLIALFQFRQSIELYLGKKGLKMNEYHHFFRPLGQNQQN